MVRFAGYRLTRAEPEEQGEEERSLRSSFSIHNCDWAGCYGVHAGRVGIDVLCGIMVCLPGMLVSTSTRVQKPVCSAPSEPESTDGQGWTA